MMKNTKRIVWGGFWLALALIFPQIFHFIGGPGLGGIFLPMHLPVFFAGLTLGPLYGLLIGCLAPVVSYLLTGMPPASPPIVVLMFFELAAYGFFAGIFYKKLKWGLFSSLLLSMAGGRIVLGLAVAFIAPLFDFSPSPLIYLKGSIFSGIPGILSQLILIPAVFKGSRVVERFNGDRESI